MLKKLLVSILILLLFIAPTLHAQKRIVNVPSGREIIVSYPDKNSPKEKVYKTLNTEGIISNSKDNQQVRLGKASVKRFCHKFIRQHPQSTCEANSTVKLRATPNDANFASLWGLQTISAPNAWDISTGSENVYVAVIDTGVDYTHPDLATNIAINSAELPSNGIDDDVNGYIDDYYGYDFSDNDEDPLDKNDHGTHVSGTIGGVGNNSIGIVGVNWKTKIIAARALDAQGYGSFADIARGVDYAVARGANVINLSIGGQENSRTLRNSLRQAAQADILVIVAAGNEGSNNDSTPSFPANYLMPNIINVAASDSSDQLAYFSNYGSNTVHLSAPGVGILSTVRNAEYDSFDGTSMATPHVVGVAALIKAINPSLGALDIRNTILSTVDLRENLHGNTITGGRLNAFAAASEAQLLSPQAPLNISDDTISITISKSGQRSSKKVRISGSISDASLGGMAYEELTLYCNGRYRGETKSNRSGSFSFRINRDLKRTLKCYVEDASDKRSSVLKVKAYMH